MPGSEALVMIVDDDELLREAIAAVLAEHGMRVVQHGSGSSALQALSGGEHPDLIMLDLVMPEMNGWEFRQRQLADAALASIPVVVMSGDRSPMAAAVHATAFLPKPIGAPDMLQKVEQVLANGRSRTARSAGEQAREPLAAYSPSTKMAVDGCLARLVFGAELAGERLRDYQLTLVARGLSHVVNNTLQGLISYSQCAPDTDRESRELQRSVFDGAHHCAAVLKKFADTALGQYAHESHEQAATLAASLPLAWERLCPPGIELHVSGLPLLREVRVGPEALLEMTTELILNAVEALPKRRGIIQVRLSGQSRTLAQLDTALPLANRRAGTWCCLEVIDDGEGICANALPHIWLAFYSTRFPGRGLGLAAVLARAKALGGLVEAESREGRGTTVRLLLPMRAAYQGALPGRASA